MSLGSRAFFLDEDDHLHRVAMKRLTRLLLRRDGSEKFPEFAGRRVRYALVFVELRGRKPAAIKYTEYAILKLDGEGRLDTAERERAARMAVDMISSRRPETGGTVIDASRRFNKKRYEHEFRWEPSPEIEAAIVRSIFGEQEEPWRPGP